MPVLLTLGHGYSAAALAATLPDWQCIGTTRSAEKAAGLRARGVMAIDWNDAPAVAAAIRAADAIVASQPPGPAGDPSLARHASDLASARAEWVGYLSTTGVYGNQGGGWVSEDDSLAATSERGLARVAAEAAWTATGLPVHHFRLSGIYGPGRSPLDRLRDGRAHRAVKPGQIFSRIHVADIARTLAASIAHPNPGRAYNLADDLPAPPQDVTAFAASLLGIAPPPEVPFEEAAMSAMARSFYAESKRVSNARIKDELGIRLLFPSYREGLRAILQDERTAAGLRA